jgi:hypothetical protein
MSPSHYSESAPIQAMEVFSRSAGPINRPSSSRCVNLQQSFCWMSTGVGLLRRSPYRPSDQKRGNAESCNCRRYGPANKSSDQPFKGSPCKSARGGIFLSGLLEARNAASVMARTRGTGWAGTLAGANLRPKEFPSSTDTAPVPTLT